MEFQSAALQSCSDGLPYFLSLPLRSAMRDDIIGVPLKWHLRIMRAEITSYKPISVLIPWSLVSITSGPPTILPRSRSRFMYCCQQR